MLQGTGIHRKIQLSKAVLLRDALTGEPVSSGIWIRSLSGGKVEKRSGGYVLFINATDTEIEFEVESPIYQSRKICVKSDQGAELEDVLMYPSPAYPGRWVTHPDRADPNPAIYRDFLTKIQTA